MKIKHTNIKKVNISVNSNKLKNTKKNIHNLKKEYFSVYKHPKNLELGQLIIL